MTRPGYWDGNLVMLYTLLDVKGLFEQNIGLFFNFIPFYIIGLFHLI